MKLSALVCASSICSSLMFSSVANATDFYDGFDKDKVEGEITFYTNRTDLVESGVYKRYESEFKALFPKVTKVNVIGFADYQGGLRPRMNTEDYGDIVLILPSVPSKQYANFYEPLTDLYDHDDIYFYDTWADNKGNDVYGISMGNSLEGLVYNKKVLKNAGVKTPLYTIDDLYNAAEKIKASGKIPMYVNFGAQWPLQQWDKFPLVIAGNENVYEDMLDEKAPFSGNTPYHTSLSVLKNFVTKGYTEKDLMTNSWEDSKNTFAKGEIGTMYLGNWVIPQLIENGAKSEDIGFMPIPANKDGTLYAQLNHDWGYAISKHSKNKDTAKAYLKFLIEKSDFDTVAGFIPTLLDKDIQSPQLKEFMSYKPNILTTPINSTEFIAATNRSKIDFYSGGYIQDLITASDFDAALKKLDSRWVKAVQKVRSSEDSRD